MRKRSQKRPSYNLLLLGIDSKRNKLDGVQEVITSNMRMSNNLIKKGRRYNFC